MSKCKSCNGTRMARFFNAHRETLCYPCVSMFFRAADLAHEFLMGKVQWADFRWAEPGDLTPTEEANFALQFALARFIVS